MSTPQNAAPRKYAAVVSKVHYNSPKVVDQSGVIECVMLRTRLGEPLTTGSTRNTVTFLVTRIVSGTTNVVVTPNSITMPPNGNGKVPVPVDGLESITINVGDVVDMTAFTQPNVKLGSRHYHCRVLFVYSAYREKLTDIIRTGFTAKTIDVRIEIDNDLCSEYFLYSLISALKRERMFTSTCIPPMDSAKIARAFEDKCGHVGGSKFYFNDLSVNAYLVTYEGPKSDEQIEAEFAAGEQHNEDAVVISSITPGWSSDSYKMVNGTTNVWLKMLVHLNIFQKHPKGPVFTVDVVNNMYAQQLHTLFGMQLEECQSLKKEKGDAFFECDAKLVNEVADVTAGFYKTFLLEMHAHIVAMHDINAALQYEVSRDLSNDGSVYACNMSFDAYSIDVWEWVRRRGVPVTARVLTAMLDTKSSIRNTFTWVQKRMKHNVAENKSSFINLATSTISASEPIEMYMMLQPAEAEETEGCETVLKHLQNAATVNGVRQPMEVEQLQAFIKSWDDEWGTRKVNVFLFGVRPQLLANTTQRVNDLIAEMKTAAPVGAKKRGREDEAGAQ